MSNAKEQFVAILNKATVFFVLLAVLLRPLVCGLSGGLATNILVTTPILAAAFLWIMGMVMRKELRFLRTPLDWPILFLIVFALASVGTAAYKRAAVSVAFDWICYVILLYLVVNLCAQTPRLVGMLLAATIASTFIVSLNGFLQHFYSLGLTRELFLKNQQSWIVSLGLPRDAVYDFVGRLATGRVFSTFLLPNTCAGFLGVMIPVQIGFLAFLHAHSSSWRRNLLIILNSIAILGAILCLYYTKSKGSWVALGMVLVAFLVISGRHILARHWPWVVAAGVAAVLLFAGLQFTHRAPPAEEYLESFAVRTQYWRAGALIIKDHPWFGVGLNNFGEFYPQYRRPQDDETLMAHNNFIQVWAETGLFGFLAFCSVWLMFFRAMGCSRANNGLPVAGNQVHMDVSFRTLAAVAAFTGFAMIYGLFNSFEPLPESAPWLLTACFGLLWFGLYFANEQAQKPVFSEKTGFLELGITFGVLFFLIHSLVEFDLYEQGVAQTLWLLMAIAVASHPRTEKAIQFTLGSRGQMLVALPMVFLVAVLLCIVYPRFLEAKIRVENARDFVASKEEQKAVSEWVAAAQDDPWDSETQVALAEIFHAQWRSGIREYKGRSTLELSLSHIRRAIALNPRRSRYHHFLARLYQEMSGLEKNPGCAGEFRRAALGEFEQAYRLFPSRAPYAADLAFAYETAGRHAEALKLYETALDLDDAARPERFTTKLSPETRREIERRLQAPRK